MEENDNSFVDANADVNDTAVAHEIIQSEPQPMPVENQQALHNAAVYQDPNRALLPGREFKPAFDGIVGELEMIAQKASNEGKHELSANLNQLLIKLGDIRNHLSEIENKVSADVKSIFSNITKIFKK